MTESLYLISLKINTNMVLFGKQQYLFLMNYKSILVVCVVVLLSVFWTVRKLL